MSELSDDMTENRSVSKALGKSFSDDGTCVLDMTSFKYDTMQVTGAEVTWRGRARKAVAKFA